MKKTRQQQIIDIINQNGGINWLVEQMEKSAKSAVNNKEYWDNLILYLPLLYQGTRDVEKDALDFEKNVKNTYSYFTKLHTKYGCPLSSIILQVVKVKMDYLEEVVSLNKRTG